MATGIGETLVAARRQQGVTLADAAAETKVRESYLAALEAEDFAALGGDVYVKGFLRSYARFLRLDPEPLLAAYRAQHEHHDDLGPLAQQPVAPLPAERSPGVVVGIGVALIVIVVLAIIGIVSGRDDPGVEDLVGVPRPVETVTAPAPSPEETEPEEEQTQEPSDDPTEVLAADGVDLTLDLEGGPSWMRVIVDGQTQFEGEQPQGTTLNYSADESITIRLGDPGVVLVTVNGREVGRIGDPGVPVTKTYTAEDAA